MIDKERVHQPRDDMAKVIQQAGVLAILEGKVCLITSNRGRWIIPKGWIDPGFTPEEAALQEAWEEAGLRGTVREEPIGFYRYEKYDARYQVSVFLMENPEILSEWPEKKSRQRVWLDPQEAIHRVEEKQLKALISALFAPVE
jgi:8-oxo-dGTP pyrophosphatase MutT (NUDIX family)